MPRLRRLLVSLAAVCALGVCPIATAPMHVVDGDPWAASAGFPVGVAEAKDLAALHRDLATGADFRLRVSAALAIGQMAQRSSVGPLAKALSDEHPAVRAAASAALGKIGDGAAIAPLEAALARESVASVKNQHAATLARLRAAAAQAAPAARFVVKLGTLSNRTGVRSAAIERTFRESTRKQVAKVPGALVPGEREDASSVARARSLPMVAIDGSLAKLASAKSGSDVGWDAQVVYLIKQMPQQQLKGTIKGRGKALANAAAVRGPSENAQLQTDAVNAAVESALGDASRAISAATR
jgi:hypothetical protein